jgi:hypothetical protein
VDFLFFGKDEGESEKTCARSFILLLINLLIASDSSFGLNLENLYLSLEDYINKEKDFRTYSEENGWIHVACHFSDLLVTLNWHKRKINIHNEALASVYWNKISEKLFESFSKPDQERIKSSLIPFIL